MYICDVLLIACQFMLINYDAWINTPSFNKNVQCKHVHLALFSGRFFLLNPYFESFNPNFESSIF